MKHIRIDLQLNRHVASCRTTICTRCSVQTCFIGARLRSKRHKWATKWSSSFAPTIGDSERSSGRAIFSAKIWRMRSMCVICLCAMHVILFLARGRRKCNCCMNGVNCTINPNGFALITSMQRLPSYDTLRRDMWPVAGRYSAGGTRRSQWR